MAGGIDWLRWHHGSVTDPKFQLVARRAGASVAEVIAVWAFLLEQASQSEDRGHPGELDFESLDCALGLPDGRAAVIFEHMQARALIDGQGRIAAWEKRQPKRERDDDSTERVREFRRRKREESAACESVTPCNATKRQEAPRGEESREDISSSLRSEESVRKRTNTHPAPDDVDESVWRDWLALRRAKKAPVTATVIERARAEAAKAGMAFGEFLAVWCARGSQGLQAEWLSPNERARGSPAKPPIAQQFAQKTYEVPDDLQPNFLRPPA